MKSYACLLSTGETESAWRKQYAQLTGQTRQMVSSCSAGVAMSRCARADRSRTVHCYLAGRRPVVDLRYQGHHAFRSCRYEKETPLKIKSKDHPTSPSL